jgi:hypothetical protein
MSVVGDHTRHAVHSGYDSVVSRAINQRGDIGRGVVRAGTILIGDGFTKWSFGLAIRIILCWLHQLQHTRPVMVTRSERALFKYDADLFFHPPHDAAEHVTSVRRHDQGAPLRDSN